jgi:hypothetical protein
MREVTWAKFVGSRISTASLMLDSVKPFIAMLPVAD